MRKVIDLNQERVAMKKERLGRKADKVKEIAKDSVIAVLRDENVHLISAGVGLMQGLKYSGNLKRGIKAGLATYGTIAASNIVYSIARRYDEIDRA